MNLRNKYLLNSLRIFFGVFILFSGVSGLYAASSGLEGIPEEMLDNTQSLLDNGIFYMIKITEVVAGLMLVFNFFPAVAVLFLAPLAVGIVVVNSFTAPAFVFMGLVVCAFVAYFGYAYWDRYKALF